MFLSEIIAEEGVDGFLAIENEVNRKISLPYTALPPVAITERLASIFRFTSFSIARNPSTPSIRAGIWEVPFFRRFVAFQEGEAECSDRKICMKGRLFWRKVILF